MKILEFSFENYGVFKEKQTLHLETQKRVMKEELTSRVSQVNGIRYNNLTTIFGANATGKTTITNGLLIINSLVQNNFNMTKFYFNDPNQIIKLDYRFVNDECFVNFELVVTWNSETNTPMFSSEKLSICQNDKFETNNTTIIMRKENSVTFENAELFLDEEFSDDAKFLIAGSMSILHLIFGQEKIKINDKGLFLLMTNEHMHHSNLIDNVDLIQYAMSKNSEYKLVEKMIKIADPAIEYLRYSKEQKEFELKFINGAIVYKRDKFSDIATFLSLGTKKIALLAIQIERSLVNGWPLIIDEIENSLHKKLIDLIISFYTMENANKNHAQLIMTTHSIELLNGSFRDDSYFYTELLINENKHQYYLKSLKTDRNNKLTLKGKASLEGKIFSFPSNKKITELIMEYNDE